MLHINILVRLWQTQRSVDSEVDAAPDPDQGEVHHAGVPALVGVHHHPVHLVLLSAAGLPAGGQVVLPHHHPYPFRRNNLGPILTDTHNIMATFIFGQLTLTVRAA